MKQLREKWQIPAGFVTKSSFSWQLNFSQQSFLTTPVNGEKW